MNSIPELGRFPGEGNGKPLQCSHLGKPMYRGAWKATCSPWGHKESDTTEQLSTHTRNLKYYLTTHLIWWKRNFGFGGCHCGLLPTRVLRPWNSTAKNTGVGSNSLPQGVFLTQGSNSGLLHCRQILYNLSQQGSPY